MKVEPHPTPHSEALYYASLGWQVIPVIPRQKRPSLNRWVEAATTDLSLIDQWWTQNPDHGVGIVTGHQSGIWALDIDPQHGGDDTLADLEHHYGQLPDTIEAITGGGGRHLIFAWPGWNPGTNHGQLGPGLDIRADGGFIVAAPTIHPNGRPYQWELSSDPHNFHQPAQAPQWLLELLKPQPAPALNPTIRTQIAHHSDQQLPTWDHLLTASGATYAGTRRSRITGQPYTLWTRPGKATKDGTSATLNHSGNNNLKIFTPNWPPFSDGEIVTQFHYYAVIHHHGDHARARAALNQAQETADLDWLAIPPAPTIPTIQPNAEIAALQITPNLDDDLRNMLIEWPAFWDGDHSDATWIAEPIFAAGRGHALYAPAKAGKSSVLLTIAAAVATGTSLFGQPKQTPHHVLYCDYEMTEADLQERLEELGYDGTSDLTHLHYALLPAFAPLDTPLGAQQLLRLAELVEAELVIIDTYGRAVAGDENEADVVRAFYRLVGKPLKAAHRAWVRTDHSGKDVDKGQRGSSAKNDDVDVVWKLTRTDTGTRITRTHSRMSWVPEKIDIARHDNGETITWKLTNERPYAAGTRELVDTINNLGIAIEAGRGATKKALLEAGIKVRNERLSDAIRWRKTAAKHLGDSTKNDLLANTTQKTPVPTVPTPVPMLPPAQTPTVPTCPDNSPRSGDRGGVTNRDTPHPPAPTITAEDLI